MKKKKRFYRWDLLPGMLLLIFLPLVAKGQKVEVDLGKYPWFPDGNFQYDFFMYWKSIVFLILVACMLLVLIDRCLLRGKKLRNWEYFIPLFLYAGLAVLSTILSADRNLSLKGMWQQYESVWVLLGYVVSVFYCAQVIENIKDARLMLWAAVAGAVIPGIIGLTQLWGKDFFYTGIGKELLSAGMDKAAKDAMEYLYAGNGTSAVYMTLYTPNYAGVYLVMILPVVIILTITAATKAGKFFGSILSIMLVTCLYGSGSRTGLIIGGILVILAAFFIQMRKRGGNAYRKMRIWPGICILAVIVAIGSYDLVNDHAVINGFRESLYTAAYDLEEIQPGENSITVKYKKHTLELIPETTEMGQMLTAVSDKKEQLTAVWDADSKCFRFRESVYEDLDLDAYSQDGTAYIVIRHGEITWNFFKEPDSSKYVYLNQYGKAEDLQNAPAVLKGYEKAFSGRGYIRGRTIPLLGRHLLWGSGPDTFAAEFPQSDYVMKANTGLGMYQQLPTKAHDLYLQSALQTGVLSAICLILFWMRYIADFVKKSRKDSINRKISQEDRKEVLLELGIFLGIVGFLLTGIMNDSNLATAPVFWCLLGTGIGIKTFHS